ncbi:MAG: histidine phosphatase family protein [Ruminococcus sp.]|nr:histidine phosphatase family protein [Candidatus Copronaster equi]
MAVKLELYLVRHGESASNAGQTDGLSYEFKTDTPLSDKGKKQAELLGEYFADYPLDCILASGLRRALNTAYEVGKRQPENGSQEIEVHKIFTECGTGEDCKGRTIDEIREEFPIMIPALGLDEKEKMIYYGSGEDDATLLARGKQAIAYLLDRFHNGEKVMVVAHAAFNTFMLYAALGLSCEQIFDPSFNNTGITKITFFEEGTGSFADIHLDYHNAVPHLVKEMPEFKY